MAVPELVPVCVVDALDGTGSIGSTVAAAADPALAREIEASQPDPPRGDMHLDGVASLLDEPAAEEAGDPGPPPPIRGRGSTTPARDRPRSPRSSTGTSTRP